MSSQSKAAHTTGKIKRPGIHYHIRTCPDHWQVRRGNKIVARYNDEASADRHCRAALDGEPWAIAAAKGGAA